MDILYPAGRFVEAMRLWVAEAKDTVPKVGVATIFAEGLELPIDIVGVVPTKPRPTAAEAGLVELSVLPATMPARILTKKTRKRGKTEIYKSANDELFFVTRIWLW